MVPKKCTFLNFLAHFCTKKLAKNLQARKNSQKTCKISGQFGAFI